MFKKIKYSIAALMACAMAFAALTATVNADTRYRNNVDAHDYAFNWAGVTTSYITTTSDGGYMIFAWIDSGAYYVEYRDSNFNYVSSKDVAVELPRFGAFATDGTNYYILSGQTNMDEDNSLECYRVTKYDSSWKRIKACSISNCNTTTPFRCGSSEMVFMGTTMLVRTDHEMYTSDDGLRHQSNYEFVINTSTMECTSQPGYTVAYCSHSFNSFGRVYNGNIYGANHGDAYPRTIAITHYTESASNLTATRGKQIETIDIPGSIGQNYTGMMLGGFEVSDTTYMAAGTCMNYDYWDESSYTMKNMNIFVAITDRSTETTTVKWITNRAPGGESYCNPFLIKISNNRYLLMWQDSDNNSDTIDYVFIDKNGNQLDTIKSVRGYTSDCYPIYANGKIVWYASYKDSSLGSYINAFYTIDASTGAYRVYKPTSISDATVSAIPDRTYDPTDDSVPDITLSYNDAELVEGTDYVVTGHTVSGSKGTITIEGRGSFLGTRTVTYNVVPMDMSQVNVAIDGSFVFTGSAIKPLPVVTYGSVTLVKDTDYTVSYSNNTNAGEATVTVTGKGNYTGSNSAQFTIAPADLSSCTASKIKDQAYTGSPVTPSVKIKNGSVVLTGGTDYTVDYSDNVDIGTATVTATGCGNYTGTLEVQFTITDGPVGPDISSCSWKKVNGKWYYLDSDGDPYTGFGKISGVWYYFDDNGVMATGWKSIEGTWYYFASSGAMKTGWMQSGKTWYFFDSEGAMATGWTSVGGTWYYFASSGAMKTGWLQVDGDWYYLASSGAMRKGWQQISKKWYFFDGDGKMLTGMWTISGKIYLFSSSGAMQTGWKQVSGYWYYFNSGGNAAIGWKKLSGKWYFFDGDGVMFSSCTVNINGKDYNFNASGACTNP